MLCCKTDFESILGVTSAALGEFIVSDWDKWSSSSKTNGRGNDFQHIEHKIESTKHIEYDSKFCFQFFWVMNDSPSK